MREFALMTSEGTAFWADETAQLRFEEILAVIFNSKEAGLME